MVGKIDHGYIKYFRINENLELVVRMNFKIKANIPEDQFMESLLNMRFAGCDVIFLLSFYALAHGWHINKFNYYFGLLELQKCL